MSAARTQELQGCIFAFSEVASKLTAECDATISRLQKEQTAVQWQFRSDQGWVDYDQPVNDMLESAHGHARGKIVFTIKRVAYTADLDDLVQKRQAKPHTESAIRRSVLAGGPQIAAMVQMVESFKQEIAQRKQKLMTDLRDAVAAIESPSVKQVQWECATDSGWVVYNAAITAALEDSYKVRATCCYVISRYDHSILLDA
jgi:WWE domain